MQRRGTHALALIAVLGSALLAYAAVGNGEIVATQPTTVVTVTSTTAGASGTATLQNTTSSTTYTVLIDSDATCDPGIGFTVSGGNPIGPFQPNTSHNITITCPPRGSEALARCRFHALNNTNTTPLADFVGACLYGASPPTLTPQQTTLDFGSLTVGDFAERTLTIRNDGAATIKRVYLMASDIDGNFEVSTPCNPDSASCDVELPAAVAPGGSFNVGLKCRPQATGTHTAQLYVGTDTFQLLSLGVSLQCTATAATQPALSVNPTTVEFPTPVEVKMESASTRIQLANAGAGTLLVKDVRVVDVDTGAADDWSYTASGACSGKITSVCMLDTDEQVDINLTFDPTQLGYRRAALLISYRDTLDRTFEIPLNAVGAGATVRRPGQQTGIAFGQVGVGRTSMQDITLVNDGTRDTMVTVSLTASTTPPFDVATGTMFTLVPGMQRTVTVECALTSAGTFTTSVSLSSPDLTSPLTIAATCEGVTTPVFATPAALQLGEIRLNAAAPTVTVQLASVGGPVALADEPTLEAPDGAITIGPLSQLTTPATFDVTVVPQGAGAITGTIRVETSAGDVVRIPVIATGVEASYAAADTLDLGTFCVNQPTTSSNVTLLSTGTATITLMPPTLGQAPSPFDLLRTAPTVYPHLLAPAKPAIVAVTPKRQRLPITVSDTLTWRTDVAGAETTMTSLTARFIDTGAAVAPPALNFGEELVHLFTANGQRVVIQNCNTTPLVLDPPNIRTPFSIDSPNFPAMLSPNESVAFSVGFHPTRVGTVMDTLRITSPQLPGQPLEVLLIGTGGSGDALAPDAGIGPGKPGDSCNCNSSNRPIGILPIAFALLLVLSPRRRFRLR